MPGADLSRLHGGPIDAYVELDGVASAQNGLGGQISNFQFSLTQVTGVPEPQTFSLAAIAMGVLLLAARFTRNAMR